MPLDPLNPNPLTHYAIVRRDLPVGFRDAQEGHAWAKTSSTWTLREGRELPDETYAVTLCVPGEAELRELAAKLTGLCVRHRAIVESHGEYAGQMTAIGIEPAPKKEVGRFVSNLPRLK